MANTKKPSAAQLAARKLFAERARAGSFKGTQKTKRAKAARVARAAKAVTVARKKNPVRKVAAKKAPVRRAPAVKKSLLPYVVKCGAKTLASFPTQAAATEYAQAYADAHKKAVSLHKL